MPETIGRIDRLPGSIATSEEIAQQLVDDLTRLRERVVAELEEIEDRNGNANYERGVAYGLSVAVNALEAGRLIERPGSRFHRP